MLKLKLKLKLNLKLILKHGIDGHKKSDFKPYNPLKEKAALDNDTKLIIHQRKKTVNK